jgi:sugar lactone lactonase YvrE
MWQKMAGGLLVLLAMLSAYLLLAPVPIEPVPWQAPVFAGYVGPHQPNTRLANLQTLSLNGEVGPEHIAIGPDGWLYTAVESGKVVRMQQDGSHYEVLAETGGRPLGFDFDAQGRLLVADAMRGLLLIGPDRKVSVLLDRLGPDDPILYADSLVVAKNGKVYLTDASHRFGPQQWGGTFNSSILDILEHSATGRVIEYDLATGQSKIVMRDLCFANGVALSQDEKSLFISETGEYRIWKLDLPNQNVSARAPGSMARLVLSNLPGYPDNLMRGANGRIWLGLTKPRSAAIDKMAASPWLRKLTLRLPRALWPVPPAYGHVLAFDESGRVVADLQDPSGAYPETSGVLEQGARLYLQSLNAHQIGYLAWRPQ